MNLFSSISFGILLCFASTLSYSQVTDTIFPAAQDSYLNSQSVSTNYGTSTLIYAGRFSAKSGGYYTRRTVVEFDLSSIPSNAIVVSAELKLNQSSSSGSPVIYAGRLKASWGETTITWANQPAHETYDLVTSSSVVSGWLTIDVQEHVQKMVAGVYDNNGWLLRNNSESVSSNTSRTLVSKENSNSSIRPKLEIEYYIPIEVSSALIEHESSDGAEDGSVSPTLNYGPGGLSYKWYNSEDSVVSTSLNLEDVPYGWYGLEVASSNVSDTFYHAFAVGVDCDVVHITFRPGTKYMDDAYISDYSAEYMETNFGDYSLNQAINWTAGGWFDGWALMKFNIWMDSVVEVTKAELNLTGGAITPVVRSNDGHFLRATSQWDEYLVTYTSQPTYATDTIDVPETTANYEDKVVDLKQYWDTWKYNNPENFGLLFALDLYNNTYARQVYYSSENATPANRPKVDFTLDLRRPPVVMEWDTVAQAGEVFIDLNNVCGKTAPYKYIIAQDSIPDLGDLYAYMNDSIFSGELDSTSFFSGTTDLTKLYDSLSSGKYYIAVFDSTWSRIVDEEIHVQKEFSFSSQTGLITNKDSITATQNDAIGSLEIYVHEGLTAHLNSQFLGLSGSQYIGFSEIDSTVNSYEDLMYGFYLVEDTVYTLQAGIPSMSYTLIDSTALLTMHIADTVLYLSIDGDTVFTKVLASGFAYKTDVGLQNGKSLLLGPYMLPYKKPRARFIGKVVQHLTCGGDPGSIKFNVGVLGTLGGPFSVDYDVKDEDGNPVVTGGTATTGIYETVTEYEGSLNPLLPGRYKITGTVNCSPVHAFVGYITLGYEADWNQVVDYDHIPNAYSLQRTVSTTTNIQESSFASTTNFLFAGNEGWTEFKAYRQVPGLDLVRFSTLNPSSLMPFPNEDLIVFANFGNFHFIYWLVSGASGLSFATLNSKMRLEFDINDVTISLNGNPLPTMPVASPSINRVLRLQTLSQTNGFEDVITSFPCPVQGLDKMSHAELKRQLDGGYTHAVEGKLLFTFDEEYDTETNHFVSLNIYDETYELKEYIHFSGNTYSGTTPEEYEFDDNKRTLDILGLALAVGEFYILEVVTSKGEKLYLRFLYKS